MKMEKRKLAIFDFDGTVTSRDSMIEFIRYYRGTFMLILSYVILFPWLAAAKLGIYSKEAAKKKFLAFHFKGETFAQLNKKANLFARQVLPSFLREKALDQMQFHRQHNHEIFVVTASLDFWTEPWFNHVGLRHVCTKAEFVNGVFTGNFLTPNCAGEEKVKRLREVINLDQYEVIYGYGDSPEDKPFLKFAQHKYYRPFRKPVKKFVVD